MSLAPPPSTPRDGLTPRVETRRFFSLAAPPRFYRATRACAPWLWSSATILAMLGLWMGFVVAPTDAVQSEAYRILYIHVPTAWLSMVMYVAMAFWAVIGWAWRVRMASMLARAIAPTGALLTAMALWTGACWGKPTWGTWWVWDARLTSELILLFLYLGYLALTSAIEDPRRSDQAGALLALVGVVNVPIIYFSVRWWNTLHQGASIRADAAPTMASTMLAALLLMTLAAWAYAFAIVFARARAIALERDHDHEWVAQLRRQEF